VVNQLIWQMKYSDFLWNEIIYGGHWLSIGAAAITLSIIILLNNKIRWELLIISYLLVQAIYTYNHYKELEIDVFSNSPRVKHLSSHKSILPYLLGLYVTLFFTILIFFGTRESIFFGGFLLIIGLLFSGGGKKISGKIVGLKSVYVSLSWAFSVPFIALYCGYPFNNQILFLFMFVFFRFFVSTNFFDIKDIKSDIKNNIWTFPIILKNKKNLITFIHLLNGLSMLPIIVGVALKILPIYSILLLVLFFYSFYYIYKVKSDQLDISTLSYIIVDGEFYYWPFLLYLGLILIS
jgi:4-hydroxybenzoate polyprenyltransferase